MPNPVKIREPPESLQSLRTAVGQFPGLLGEARHFLLTGKHPAGETNHASRPVLKSATSPSLQRLHTQASEYPRSWKPYSFFTWTFHCLKRNLGWSWTAVCMQGSPTHLACLMAPSRVLKRAPHSSTTQWKCTLCRKSHWASQKSFVPNLAKTDKQTSQGRPQERSGVGTDIISLF